VVEMAFHVRDEATDSAVRRLANLKGKTLTATIREAVEREYEREQQKLPLMERLRALHEWVAAHSGPGGLPADKTFYDELSGEDELTGLP
jgi:antitoxin VapB